ncbi:GrpB family protein [Frigidibacter sp. MR17.14]|uniref:GrpB family protein n=1 Tax=Frigidibacter sp. MR17.14 TaxID=3126509 RepID=UPI003012BAAC
MAVEVVAHDPRWAEAFAAEARAIAPAVGGVLHHIGSTAVPGLPAKPIIDMLGEVASFSAIDTAALTARGYQAMGAFGIPSRRYFRRCGPDGRRSHHLHVFLTGSTQVERHLAFRDYLRAHPAQAEAYGALKLSLLGPGTAWEDYMDGKAPFIAATEVLALVWHRAR